MSDVDQTFAMLETVYTHEEIDALRVRFDFADDQSEREAVMREIADGILGYVVREFLVKPIVEQVLKNAKEPRV